MSPDDPRHGTTAGRKAHETAGTPICVACARAAARYEQELQLDRFAGRPRILPARGTRRRVQALVALGHTFARMAEALEMTQSGACALAHRPASIVRSSTATKVASLYDAWSMTLPPAGTGKERKAATYARTVAAKHGWLPPLAWDDIDNDSRPAVGAVRRHDPKPLHVVDLIVVERALAGEHVAANVAERRQIVAAARGRGWPLEVITDRTGITKPERYLPDTIHKETA